MKRWIACILFAFGFGLALGPAPAQADTITWQIQSFSRYQVNVKFYSMNRRHQWPSTTSHYPLKNYNVQKISISCLKGEKVCYGAVVANGTTNWGRGPKGTTACPTCCYTCNGNVTTRVVQLNER